MIEVRHHTDASRNYSTVFSVETDEHPITQDAVIAMQMALQIFVDDANSYPPHATLKSKRFE